MNRFSAFLTSIFPLLIVAGTTAADIGLSLIALLFLLHSLIARDWSWTRASWVKCLLALWAYIVVRDMFALQPWDALRRALPFGRYIFFAAGLAFWTLQDATTRERFLSVLAVAVFFCAGDGLLQWCTGHDLLHHPFLIDTENHIRLTGPFHKQYLGIMIAWLSFPACLWLLMPAGEKANRCALMVAGAAIALTALAAIALSGERMALILTLFGGLMAGFLLPLRRSHLFAAMGLGAVLIALLAYASPMLFERQILTTFFTFAHWRDSPYGLLLASDLKIAALNPVFGVGTNHFRIVCDDVFRGQTALPMTSYCNTHPHNLYLEWLIESGVIGFALFAGFVMLALRECIKAWPGARLNPAFLGCIIAFMLRIWPVQSTTSFFSPWGAPPFWLMTGALLAFCNHTSCTSGMGILAARPARCAA